jgi:DUF177 domain-containing protein
VPPVELRLGGQEYRVEPDGPEVALRVGRSLTGMHMRMTTAVDLVGPCWRCLEPARAHLVVESEEIAAEEPPAEGAADEDLHSAYVEDMRLDVDAWARDAIAEAVPPTILCRDDCAGLCPACGADRNAGDCGCVAEEADPRWDALRGLSERLGGAE